VRHPLPQLLAVGLSAVMAGARSFAAIDEWAAGQMQPGATAAEDLCAEVITNRPPKSLLVWRVPGGASAKTGTSTSGP